MILERIGILIFNHERDYTPAKEGRSRRKQPHVYLSTAHRTTVGSQKTPKKFNGLFMNGTALMDV